MDDVYYWGTEDEWNAIAIDSTNELFTEITCCYPGPASITSSTPKTGAKNPVVTVTSDRPFKPITARSATMNNVTVDEGTTGLTLSSVSLDPSDTSNKTMLLGFDGSSEGGDVNVTIDSSAFAGPENFTSTEVFRINMPRDPSLSPETGSLTIENIINGGPSEAASKLYTFTVAGPDNYSQSVSITGAGQTTLNVPAGAYTVTLDTNSAAIGSYTLNTANNPASATVTAGNTSLVTITNTYKAITSNPSGPSTSSSSSPSRKTSKPTPKPTENPPTVGGESPIQPEALRKDREDIPDWVDRLKLPDYARKLYSVMAGETRKEADGTGRKQSVFEDEQNFRVRASQSTGAAQVEQVEIVDFDMVEMYGPAQVKLNSSIFEDEDFFRVSASAGDKAVDYSSLNSGSVIKTSAYNGVYTTKIPYEGDFDTKKKDVCSYIAAAYHAFDRDEPGIFWLNGKCRVCISIVTNPGTGMKEAYFFLVLADKEGFTQPVEKRPVQLFLTGRP